MTMNALTRLQNSHRILTAHVGSLPRPKDLLDLMRAKATGAPPYAELYAATPLLTNTCGLKDA